MDGYISGHQLALKEDLILTKNLLEDVKWSKVTYMNVKQQQNDARLGTDWIEIDPNSIIEVQFSPSLDQTDWDILGKLDNGNTDDGWCHDANTIWYPDTERRSGQKRKPLNCIAIVLNNPGKANKVTCSFKVTQKTNVIEYIKDNFDTLKSHLGG